MKNKLALYGGPKTIKTKTSHFTWPPIDKKTEKEVVKQLYRNISIYDRSGIFKEFEDDFKKFYQRKYALLCNSGTTAIHSMFVAANFQPGDEVVCPAYTFFATVTPLLFLGANPVLCDIDENGNISPEEIEKKITPKTKAVVITHMWGIPCQMDKIVKICRKHKLFLLEDCSHAHGAEYKGKRVGSFGDISAWSIQGPKNVSGGEGGILTTNKKDFYFRSLLLGHYNKRCRQEIPKSNSLRKYAITGMGLKYRAHPLAVVIAQQTFKNLKRYLRNKRAFSQRMIKALKKESGISFLPAFFDTKFNPAWYGFIFHYCSEELDNLPIEKFHQALLAEGLSEADRPGSTCPLNLLPLFQKPAELFPLYQDKKYSFSYKVGDFPKAEKFYQEIIKLPVWAQAKDFNLVDLYIKGIKKVIKNYKELL